MTLHDDEGLSLHYSPTYSPTLTSADHHLLEDQGLLLADAQDVNADPSFLFKVFISADIDLGYDLCTQDRVDRVDSVKGLPLRIVKSFTRTTSTQSLFLSF